MKAIRPRFRMLGAGLALALVSSCSAPQPAPPPAPAPAPPPPVAHPLPPTPLPAPPADWRDAPQTPGDWRWAMVSGRSTASYGSDPAAPVATLACYREQGEVRLSRTALLGDGAAQSVPMALTASNGTRPLFGEPSSQSQGWLVVRIKADDPILDTIAFSRGRFALEAQGQPTLYLPSWPEISRVIEDCR